MWLLCIKLLAIFPLIVKGDLDDYFLLTNFTQNIVKSSHVVLFGCQKNDLRQATQYFFRFTNQFVHPICLRNNTSLKTVLTHKSHGRIALIVDGSCPEASKLIMEASNGKYFNKTYQWLIMDQTNHGFEKLLPRNLSYIGPNAQITYVNGTEDFVLLWDIHSKGLHLNAPFELNLYASGRRIAGRTLEYYQLRDIRQLQGFNFRDNFNGLVLRGATVIDQDNILTNEQIEAILSRRTKDSGVAAFSKYHYELLSLLRFRLNFTVNFRNARGWASRLGNSTFRLGFLGIIKRNEADVGASAAFNRINRFAEFDTIHQSWKFETAFVYRFTPELGTHGKSGNFLAPFNKQVWLISILTLLFANLIWRLLEFINQKCQLKHHIHNNYNEQLDYNDFHYDRILQKKTKGPKPQFYGRDERNFVKRNRNRLKDQQKTFNSLSACYSSDFYSSSLIKRSFKKIFGKEQGEQIESQTQGCVNGNDGTAIEPRKENVKQQIRHETSFGAVSLQTFAAVCQQGLDPVPKGLPSRTLVLTMFLFSLVMYNYYTSSVVGGLLSTTAQGPSTVEEIVSSPLKLSFEDIGYYKVLFRENKSPMVLKILESKLSAERNAEDLPVYSHIEDAIPFLKTGSFTFHCEVVDAYPVIAKDFDANEICDLRVVSGLMETDTMNWVVSKNSQYTELFRNIMCRARETGLVTRLLRERQPRKPQCLSSYTVYPVSLSGVLSGFFIVIGGYFLSFLTLLLERFVWSKCRVPQRNK